MSRHSISLKPKPPHEVSAERAWWRGRRVAVWGAARTGIATSKLLHALGAIVTLSDAKQRESLTGLEELPDEVTCRLGAPNEVGDAEVLIPSPGLKPTHPLIMGAQAQGVRLMSEIELAARVCAAPIIAVTGTDGKSTTTLLITEALRAQGIWAQPVGNIGDPFANWALEESPKGVSAQVFVVEVSAFQLWLTQRLDAQIGVITNIVDDHLDYFDGDPTAYRASKLKLAELLTPHAPLLYPPSAIKLDQSLSREGQAAVELTPYHPPLSLIQSKLLGAHNQLNLSAALKVIELCDLDEERARAQLSVFTPLPYRLTHSGERGGVTYLNDSKATNVHAALMGIKSLSGDLLVITGGYEKGLDLTEWIEVLAQRASAVFTIGQTGDRIAQALLERGVSCISCGELEVAVREAERIAQPGDQVVLSPAASSFDQFDSYEARGAIFDLLVTQLPSRL